MYYVVVISYEFGYEFVFVFYKWVGFVSFECSLWFGVNFSINDGIEGFKEFGRRRIRVIRVVRGVMGICIKKIVSCISVVIYFDILVEEEFKDVMRLFGIRVFVFGSLLWL